ncbi:hypothetical protein D3C80_1730910 [compost metagenome]
MIVRITHTGSRVKYSFNRCGSRISIIGLIFFNLSVCPHKHLHIIFDIGDAADTELLNQHVDYIRREEGR